MFSKTFFATFRKRPIPWKRSLLSGSSAERTAEVMFEPKTVAGVPSTRYDLEFVVSSAGAGTIQITYCTIGSNSSGAVERDANSVPMH